MAQNLVQKTKRVWIVVLGDIGRSPRMQNHCQSFAENGYLVEMCGYQESKPNQEILSDPRININKLTRFPEIPLPRILKYLFKIFWTILSLLAVFLSVRKADILIMQNPPGIPALIMCYFYCKIVKAQYIIDWHNYTWSIMALESSSQSKVVKCAKHIENFFGKKSDLNFCVTQAMSQDLADNWDIEAKVLYDRPPEKFQAISNEKKHNLFEMLSVLYPEFKSDDENSTVFTQKLENGEVKMRDDRPGIIVSSTSWTPDEDFQVLLDALIQYDENANDNETKFPKIVCVITGKGPLKSFYQQKIAERNWKFVKIVTPWLENEDYPLILAAADLGVCLHYSSSGLDLPMKVVDMFGCGLPVCAMNFKW
jgi:beta-1,4-mannosyltransferase